MGQGPVESSMGPQVRKFLCQAQNGAIKIFVLTCAGEIVKGLFRDADDMVFDEGCTFPGSVFRVFDAAFPFQHRPAFEVILGKFAENGLEIDLSVPEGAEASCPIDPALVAAIYALFAGRVEFCVLDMEHADAFVVDIDIFQIIQALQDEMRRVIQKAGAGVVAGVL